jgi:hypothetical protein
MGYAPALTCAYGPQRSTAVRPRPARSSPSSSPTHRLPTCHRSWGKDDRFVGGACHDDPQLIKGVTVSDIRKFGWLSRDESPLHDIYGVSFIRDLSPHEALTRLGVDTDTIEEMTFDELDEYANESMLESDGDARYVGAVKVDDWTVLIEPSGWRVAAEPGVRERVSRGTEVVSVNRHDYASDDFIHTIDGDVITRFEPLVPHLRSGSDPDRWVHQMRDVGLGRRTFDDPIPDDRIASAFALASIITGISFSRDVLNMTFLGAAVTEQ